MLVGMTSLRDDIGPNRMIKRQATRTCQDVRLVNACHAIQFSPFGEHFIAHRTCRRCVSSTSERSRRRYYCPLSTSVLAIDLIRKERLSRSMASAPRTSFPMEDRQVSMPNR
jgi:hypothetical protein